MVILRPLADRRLGELFQNGAPVNKLRCQSFKPQKSVIELIFAKYDDDENGNLAVNELQSLCYDYGYYLTDEETKETLTALDKNKDDSLTYDEFLEWWKTNTKFSHLSMNDNELCIRKLLVEVFQNQDKNNSGSIEMDEYLAFYTNIRKIIPQIKGICRKELWTMVDSNNSGSIEFNELVEYLLGIGAICAAFD